MLHTRIAEQTYRSLGILGDGVSVADRINGIYRLYEQLRNMCLTNGLAVEYLLPSGPVCGAENIE